MFPRRISPPFVQATGRFTAGSSSAGSTVPRPGQGRMASPICTKLFSNHADGVEKHIAGFENSFVQIGDAMRPCPGLGTVDPALELAAVERPVAWTKGGEILLGNMVL